MFTAVVSGLDPAGVTVLVVLLSRSRPTRLLGAYFVGGFGMSLIIGVVILFALNGIGVGGGTAVPPGIDFAVAALALIVAFLVGSGIAGIVRGKIKMQQRRAGSRGADAVWVDTAAAADVPRGVERLSAFQKLPPRAQKALQGESVWLAWIAGVGTGMPDAYYLAAIAAILSAGAWVGASIAALLVFNIIAFMLTEIFLVSFLRAPDPTRARIDRLHTWTSNHHRVVVSVLASIVGVFLVVVGITKL